jgi:hypothetical protein
MSSHRRNIQNIWLILKYNWYELVSEMTLQGYKIKKYKCLGSAVSHRFPIDIYKNNEIVASKFIETDSCTIRFQNSDKLFVNLDICDDLGIDNSNVDSNDLQILRTPDTRANSTKKDNLIICQDQMENNLNFESCFKEYDLFILKSASGEVVYQNDNNPSEFVFKDFNEDGFIDIELHFITNVPGVNELLLFDPLSKSFKDVENFSNFPASIKITNTPFYYSYSRAGCADANWESYLYIFDKNKVKAKGKIRAITCEGETDAGIYFYKMSREVVELINYSSITDLHFENKWEFIEEYWTTNSWKFK